jgi:hypothetical protein
MPRMTALFQAGTRVRRHLFPAVAPVGAEAIPAGVVTSAKGSISTATTTNFSFGAPADIDLRALAKAGSYKPGDKLLVMFTGTTPGTTDSLTFSVQDAQDDGAGNINTGTLAAAITAGDAMAVGTSDGQAIVAITPQAGRPWLRFRMTSTGATDTFTCTASVIAVKGDVQVTAEVTALRQSDPFTGRGATDLSLEGAREVVKYTPGQIVPRAEIDAHFPAATVPGALSRLAAVSPAARWSRSPAPT